jgi:hypothetical protein
LSRIGDAARVRVWAGGAQIVQPIYELVRRCVRCCCSARLWLTVRHGADGLDHHLPVGATDGGVLVPGVGQAQLFDVVRGRRACPRTSLRMQTKTDLSSADHPDRHEIGRRAHSYLRHRPVRAVEGVDQLQRTVVRKQLCAHRPSSAHAFEHAKLGPRCAPYLPWRGSKSDCETPASAQRVMDPRQVHRDARRLNPAFQADHGGS